jgi:acid phosphatase type 7
MRPIASGGDTAPNTRAGFYIALSVLVFACSRDDKPTPPPAAGSQLDVSLAGAAVMIGAGDIAVCGASGDESTARLIDSVLTADSAANVVRAVFTLGDNAYRSGSSNLSNYFQRCFTPSWGKARIMNLIHPSPGNHDYDSGSGAPYFAYFGANAGPPGKGYYSYDVGSWHVISLNSELYFSRATPEEAKAQEDWLKEDLTLHSNPCTLAYFHRPLFSSGDHAGTREMLPLWKILYDGGVDLILNGHDHHYERFRPQNPDGVYDPLKGITEIIVGTGGASLRRVFKPLAANSVDQVHGHYGILKLTLGAGEYRHLFLGTDGIIWDSGSGKRR